MGKEMTVADESCSGCTNSAGFRKRGGADLLLVPQHTQAGCRWRLV